MTGSDCRIRRAAVIGAGTMGAGIAALLASAGIQVDLLDIVPPALTPDEVLEGLDLSSPKVRNRVAEDGWDRARASRPVNALPSEVVERVAIGNLEDDLGRLRGADWIIEAVVEDLSIKRHIMATLDTARAPECVVSTNTSGIPVRKIVQGRSEEFARHFMGTHFFNPPLIMKAVELIPGPGTDGTVLQSMRGFLESRLQKGVVLCKDTPNFIANRVGSIQSSHDMAYVLEHAYTVEEADAILGPMVGRPSTAVFRLRDLVGLDVSTQVAENLFRAIPDDRFCQVLMQPRLNSLRRRMVDRGLLGRKSGSGFYRAVNLPDERRFLPIDLETLEYRDRRPIDSPTLTKARQLDDLGERLRFLVAQKDRVGELVWASLSNVMAYAAYCLPEIADDVQPVDLAMRLGYSWEMGPFEIWDALGVPATLDRMKRNGLHVTAWLDEMLRAGYERFYEAADGVNRAFSPAAMDYLAIESGR